jgi:tellurite resistance protein TerC
MEMQASNPKNFLHKLLDKICPYDSPRVKKIIVALIGGTVFVIGIALLVLPGPAFIVIPAGLTILATEFAWARRWLQKGRALFDKAGRATAKR